MGAELKLTAKQIKRNIHHMQGCQIKTNAAKNRDILPLLSILAGVEGFELVDLHFDAF